MSKAQQQVKAIVLGSSGVGKSCILMRFISNKFDQMSQTTIGAAFLSKVHNYEDGKTVKFQIWDTAGQQRYRSIAPIYYKNAQAAICVYDITNKQSFATLKTWVQQLRKKGPQNVVIAVVGNKIDLTDYEQVSFLQAKQYANEINAIFKLVSAKQGKGIDQLFSAIATKLQQKSSTTNRSTFILKDRDSKFADNQKKKKKCCH